MNTDPSTEPSAEPSTDPTRRSGRRTGRARRRVLPRHLVERTGAEQRSQLATLVRVTFRSSKGTHGTPPEVQRGGSEPEVPEPSERHDVRRAQPRRVRRQVVRLPLRLALRLHPLARSARPRARSGPCPSRAPAPSARPPHGRCASPGRRSRSRSGSAGSARRPDAARPRARPRRRSRPADSRPRAGSGSPSEGSAAIRSSTSCASEPYRFSRCSTRDHMESGARRDPRPRVPQRAVPLGAEQRDVLGHALGDPLVEAVHRLVDRVLGHHPVRRVLAARHHHQPRHRVRHGVLARELAGGVATRRPAAAAARRTRPRRRPGSAAPRAPSSRARADSRCRRWRPPGGPCPGPSRCPSCR